MHTIARILVRVHGILILFYSGSFFLHSLLLLPFPFPSAMCSMNLFVVSLLIFVANAGAFVPNHKTSAETKCAPLHMGLLSRFRKKEEIINDPIKVGSPLPRTDIQTISDGEIVPMSIQEALGDGKSILVGMPGAFTTTCTKTHLPGYIENASKLAKLGVDKIAIITTNDKFVNGAWAKEVGLDMDDPEHASVMLFSDGDSELVRELGLVEDMGFGVGIRSKRFALVVEDGVVSHLETDDGIDDCSASSAENMIQVLSPPKEEGSESELELDGTTLALVGGGGVLAFLYIGSLGGDADTASTTVQAVAPALKKEAVDTGFSLLENFR